MESTHFLHKKYGVVLKTILKHEKRPELRRICLLVLKSQSLPVKLISTIEPHLKIIQQKGFSKIKNDAPKSKNLNCIPFIDDEEDIESHRPEKAEVEIGLYSNSDVSPTQFQDHVSKNGHSKNEKVKNKRRSRWDIEPVNNPTKQYPNVSKSFCERNLKMTNDGYEDINNPGHKMISTTSSQMKKGKKISIKALSSINTKEILKNTKETPLNADFLRNKLVVGKLATEKSYEKLKTTSKSFESNKKTDYPIYSTDVYGERYFQRNSNLEKSPTETRINSVMQSSSFASQSDSLSVANNAYKYYPGHFQNIPPDLCRTSALYHNKTNCVCPNYVCLPSYITPVNYAHQNHMCLPISYPHFHLASCPVNNSPNLTSSCIFPQTMNSSLYNNYTPNYNNRLNSEVQATITSQTPIESQKLNHIQNLIDSNGNTNKDIPYMSNIVPCSTNSELENLQSHISTEQLKAILKTVNELENLCYLKKCVEGNNLNTNMSVHINKGISHINKNDLSKKVTVNENSTFNKKIPDTITPKNLNNSEGNKHNFIEKKGLITQKEASSGHIKNINIHNKSDNRKNKDSNNHVLVSSLKTNIEPVKNNSYFNTKGLDDNLNNIQSCKKRKENKITEQKEHNCNSPPKGLNNEIKEKIFKKPRKTVATEVEKLNADLNSSPQDFIRYINEPIGIRSCRLKPKVVDNFIPRMDEIRKINRNKKRCVQKRNEQTPKKVGPSFSFTLHNLPTIQGSVDSINDKDLLNNSATSCFNSTSRGNESDEKYTDNNQHNGIPNVCSISQENHTGHDNNEGHVNIIQDFPSIIKEELDIVDADNNVTIKNNSLSFEDIFLSKVKIEAFGGRAQLVTPVFEILQPGHQIPMPSNSSLSSDTNFMGWITNDEWKLNKTFTIDQIEKMHWSEKSTD